ncbi:unnamed protein product [Staurois parvus]|uniref:Uncharacterized protein n=1 Tax=Staurois parvus TaxID=386267 RepID=A0ABN9BIA2_9NEOB|nr:unnamed protein product [Staurois parvus]
MQGAVREDIVNAGSGESGYEWNAGSGESRYSECTGSGRPDIVNAGFGRQQI